MIRLTRGAVMLSGVVSIACNGGNENGDAEPFFPLDLDGYVEVRACRAPGEHSGLGGFSVWANAAAVDALNAIWIDPPGREALPADSVVVKASYSGDGCDPADLDHWVAMKKEPGFDPSQGDWRWQEVAADGTIVSDGPTGACIDCHEGPDSSTCIGYGAMNGRDYLCTAP